MSDFKSKKHQYRFRLGLRPRPRWGVYSAPPEPWLDLRGPSSKGRKGKGKKGKVNEGEGMEWGRGKGRNDLPYDFGDLEMTWLL